MHAQKGPKRPKRAQKAQKAIILHTFGGPGTSILLIVEGPVAKTPELHNWQLGGPEDLAEVGEAHAAGLLAEATSGCELPCV